MIERILGARGADDDVAENAAENAANNAAVDAAVDVTLVKSVQGGDLRALGELYVQHSVLVQKAVLRTMPEISDADKEDLVQDVFVSLLSLLANYDSARAFRPWLYGVTVKKTQNFRRKRGVRALLLRRRAAEDAQAIVQPAVDGQLERAQMMEGALAKLPKGQKDVLILHAVEGFKGEEIAGILNIEVNTVWSRLHRARNTLQQYLEERRSVAGGNDNGV